MLVFSCLLFCGVLARHIRLLEYYSGGATEFERVWRVLFVRILLIYVVLVCHKCIINDNSKKAIEVYSFFLTRMDC